MSNQSNYDLKLLHDRLEDFQGAYSEPADIESFTIFGNAITAIDELLAFREAAEKPVAWEVKGILCHTLEQAQLYIGEPEPLYTAPPLPVVPDGYVIVPRKLTAENGAKGALLGEFLESKYINCQECFGDDECESCDGSGRIKVDVTVSWSTIKNIYSVAVELLGNPEQVNSPTIPDGWVSVSDRLPEHDDLVLVWPTPDFGVETHTGQYLKYHKKGAGWFAQVSEQNYGIEFYSINVTHWMPLPAAPKQEVESE